MAATPRTGPAPVTFTQAEQELCREAFMRFDKDKNGTIDSYELKSALEAFGSKCSDEEVFVMISEVDLNANGVVDFAEFVKVLLHQKERAAAMNNENDLIDAFIACGGQPDLSGYVEKDRLVKIIKEDFGLTLDIEKLISRYDGDGTGQMEYSDFKALLTSADPQ